MKTLVTNISKILHIAQNGEKWKRGLHLGDFPITEKAWLLAENGRIHSIGKMADGLPENVDYQTDALGGMLLPTWADSHTHLVFAGTREDEFAMRLHGMSYEEIAERGGGILNSAQKLRDTSEDELYESAAQRLDEVMRMGTGAIEIKSGYGLTTESEIKMLTTARRLGENFPLPIKTTFLGAHAFPVKFKNDHAGYVRLLIDEMMPEIASQNLADYVDVFCEKGYFSVDETLEIVEAAQKFSLKAKLHVNQFNILGMIEKGIGADVLSVDHLEVLAPLNSTGPQPGLPQKGEDDGVENSAQKDTENDSKDEAVLLGKSDTIATLLPGCSLFIEIPFAPARRLIENDAIVALATDYNPGSSPSGNMNLAVALACIRMKMTPEEAISAATLNGAAAIELSGEIGSIEEGKRANFILTRPLSSPSFLPYNFGHDHISKVFINGEEYGG